MNNDDTKKVFAILYEIKKRIKIIEDNLVQEEYRKCRPGRSEQSEELLHGGSPSG